MSSFPSSSSVSTTSTSENIIAGAFAGATARLVTAPFDVMKIRYQLQFSKAKYTSIFDVVSTIIKEEGVIGLWKGNIAATYLWISYSMVQFGVYGFLKESFEKLPDPFMTTSTQKVGLHPKFESNAAVDSDRINSNPQQGKLWRAIMLFFAGAGAGIIATTATYPFDIMRTQFAIQGKNKVYTSMNSFIKDSFKTKGIKG